MLSGCAGVMRSYDGELKQTMTQVENGQIDISLQTLEKNNDSKDKDLLYFLEKGELLRLKQDVPESRDSWLSADEKVRIWEEEARTSPEKLLGNVGSVIINDKTRRYDGRDYEKVFLNTRLALDHLVLGEWDKARTEIKKMHEREAIIAELRAKDVADVEEKASKNGVQSTFKDLKGYPVETLDAPEVTSLKNGYQSAYAHYLAGYVYEALGEPSLAAAGYRQAIELRPDLPFLEEGLKGLDQRRTQSGNGTDVLFVIETGASPAIKSMSIPLPMPLGSHIGVIPISFPTIHPDANAFVPASLGANGTSVQLHPVTSVNTMARRALRDEMPGIIVRGAIRAIAKGVAQKAAMDNDSSGVAGLLIMLGGIITESADERSWRTLPDNVLVGRANLKPGTYSITLQTPVGEKTQQLEVSGRHNVVALRILGNTLYLSHSAAPPREMIAALPATVEPQAVAATPTVAPPPTATPVSQKPVAKKKKKKSSNGTAVTPQPQK